MIQKKVCMVGAFAVGKAGLGLYFCRLMAERWGGFIECSTRPAGGARFSVALLRS